MPVYEYRGVNSSGRAVKGVMDADSPKGLKDVLRAKGVFVSDIHEAGMAGKAQKGARLSGDDTASPKKSLPFFTRKVKVMELAEITRQIATLVRAAIPVVDALTAVSKQVENPRLQLVMNEVRRAVTEGKGLGNAMADHPEVFTDLYINMVKAGEQSGTLDLVFDRLADFTENQSKLRSKLIGSMMYPIIMLVVGSGIVSLLMMFVVPKLTQMFAEMGGKLPAVTRALIAVSGFLENWWYLFFGSIALSVFWFNRFRKGSGKNWWDGFVLRVPIFGPLMRMVSVTRFSSTLGTLLSSGVPIVTALEITKHVVGNLRLAKAVQEAIAAVQEGESLAKPLERSGEFPPMVVHMIAVGEQSGSLESMLDNVTRAYETQVDSKITVLTSLLEPLMILGMGVIVALIVFAILMPMLQMNELLKG